MVFETGALAQAKPYTMYDLQTGRQMTIIEDIAKTQKPRVIKINGQKGPYEVAHLKVEVGILKGELELAERYWNKLWRAMPASVTNLKNVTISFDNSIQEIVFICQEAPRSDSIPNYGTPIVGKYDNAIQELIKKMNFAKECGMTLDESRVTGFADKTSPGNAPDLIKAAKDAGMITESSGIFVVR